MIKGDGLIPASALGARLRKHTNGDHLVNSETLPAQIGKYWVKRLLGSGGMGRVFLAVDPDIGREVAIKLVTLGKDPQANERFLREAQTMGRLNHPNIVTLLEFGVDQQNPFLVLEFLSGEDLSQWMHRPQSLRDQVRVMLGVAEAIDAAHRMGVLHRDLKPENVRVLEDGRCKLLDFGIAQSGASSLTASGYFVGTPEFVAPEVMSGATHSALADIYSLGLLFYTMLAGDNPFRGDTVQATVARVVATAVPPLSSRISGAPKALAALIEQCVQKLPEQRPATADVVIAGLKDILAGIAPEARVQQIAPPAKTAPVPLDYVPTQSASKVAPVAPTATRRWLWGVLAISTVGLGVWLLRPPPLEVPFEAESPPAVTLSPATSATEAGEPAAAPAKDAVDSIDEQSAIPADDVAASADQRSAAVLPPEPAKEEPAPAEPDPAPPAAKPVRRVESGSVAAADSAKPAKTQETDVAVTPPISPPPVPDTRRESAPADDPPAAVADREPETVPAAPQVVPAVTPAPPSALISIEIQRFNPRVIRAGRTVTLRIEGAGLDAVTAAMVSSGGVPDSRFRIGDLHHRGSDKLEFSLNVARGVPLGSYPLLLQGAEVRVEPIILEVSL